MQQQQQQHHPFFPSGGIPTEHMHPSQLHHQSYMYAQQLPPPPPPPTAAHPGFTFQPASPAPPPSTSFHTLTPPTTSHSVQMNLSPNLPQGLQPGFATTGAAGGGNLPMFHQYSPNLHDPNSMYVLPLNSMLLPPSPWTSQQQTPLLPSVPANSPLPSLAMPPALEMPRSTASAPGGKLADATHAVPMASAPPPSGQQQQQLHQPLAAPMAHPSLLHSAPSLDATASSSTLMSHQAAAEPRDNGPKQLIVNFLDLEVTNAELHAAFSAIGPLDAARVIYDKESNQSKGFGFVYFHHSRDAATAMQCMTGHPIRGKRIKVSLASPQRPLNARMH